MADPTPQADRAPLPKPPLHICSDAALKTMPNPLTVGFRIAPDGTVAQAAILQSSGSQPADLAATACIKTWTYEPALRGGVPIEWQARVTLQAEQVGGTFMGFNGRQNATMANVTPAVAKALNRLIRDAQSRCQAFYRTDVRHGDTMHARNRVVAKRFADGHIETTISQPSPVHGADAGARACVAYMIGKHDDLPPVFAVEIEINWARYIEPEEH